MVRPIFFHFISAFILLADRRVFSRAEGGSTCYSSAIEELYKEKYDRDGFIVLRGILDEALVQELVEAGQTVAEHGQSIPPYFSVAERGLIFNGATSDASRSNFDHAQIFREVALYSKIPRIVAELMQLDPKSQNLRVIRDIFLSRELEEPACDWHVDDQGFWPESFLSSASMESGKDQSGVNVWISLEDMPFECQGSMALSAGSHKAPWRFEAYDAIGQNRRVDGGSSKESIIQRMEEKRKNQTATVTLGACTIGTSRPDLKENLEARKVLLDIRKGDVIFSTRTLFHKTSDVTEEGLKYYRSKGITRLNRYSIRYSPGTARLPNGWVAEWSAASNERNKGQTLDDIVNDSKVMWYPRVWPSLEEDIDAKLDSVAENELNSAQMRVQAEIYELFVPKSSGQTK